MDCVWFYLLFSPFPIACGGEVGNINFYMDCIALASTSFNLYRKLVRLVCRLNSQIRKLKLKIHTLIRCQIATEIRNLKNIESRVLSWMHKFISMICHLGLRKV